MTTSVSTHTVDGTLTVVIVGDIDLDSGARVEAEISAAATTPGVQTIIVDLSRVAFLDSAGIATLVHGRRRADKLQLGFQLVGATGMVRRVLDLTGVWDFLTDGPGR
jgi:anti-sigma B factor antagonist